MSVSRQRLEQIRNPHKHKARKQAQRAHRRGLLRAPDVCESCKGEGPLHKHHDDYSKPLEIRWLCVKCHRVTHRRPGKSKVETEARANVKKLRAIPGMEKIADSLTRLMDGASRGGKARAKKLSKKRRIEIARKAANIRWGLNAKAS